MKAVRFTRSVSLYNAGEVAGFDDPVAQAYVDAGAAEWYQAAPAPPAPEAERSEAGSAGTPDPLAFQKGTDRKRGRGLRG